MMINEFTYEIVVVNTDLKIMEVVYRASGYPDVTVGTKMPFEGDDINEFIKSYAPFGYWYEYGKQHASISVGTTGTIVLNTITTTTYSVDTNTNTNTSNVGTM